MATASANVRIPVSADNVWALVGGFQSLPNWLPFIVESAQEEGGRIRRLKTDSGEQITERLESFDNHGKTYSYSITQGPFPVTDYLATLTVKADGENAAQVEWSGTFTPDGISVEEAEALFLGVYQGGLDALKANF